MAKHLDLEEQEQLDQIKHFWARYGNLITGVLIVVFGSIAAWNGWNYWQRNQAAQAAALYEEVERAVIARNLEQVERAQQDLQSRFGGTTYAIQGSLLAARTWHDEGDLAKARPVLRWVIEHADDAAYAALARLRLAAIDVQDKALDAALQTLSAPVPKAFEPLVADRRGDVYAAQGKTEEALAQYRLAWQGMSDRTDYRQLVGVKLAALGVSTETLGGSTQGVQ